MRIRTALASLFLISAIASEAEITMPSFFNDNMVLQQNSAVTFRGTAKPNAKVTVETSWNNKKVSTKSDENGNWATDVLTPAYGGPFDIVVSDGDIKTLKNIYIGEVWLCSGQSNMEMPLRGFTGQPVDGSQEMIAEANSQRNIRLFRQENAWSTTPLNDIPNAKWELPTSDVVSEFSAVGYVFAEQLEKSLDVPVGIIQCAWSMSTIQAWMPRETFSNQFPDIKLPNINGTEKDFGWLQGTPTLLWNAMVNPWKGFPIAGVLWYQGEANTPDAKLYSKLFPAMVNDWRKLFNNDSLPFYYAQLAPWKDMGCEKTLWADFRQVQNDMLAEVSNTGMVTTGDLGDSLFIHFPKKIPVGKRFAYLALNNVYGSKGIMSEAPIAMSCEKNEDGTYWIRFKGGEKGLTPENKQLQGFELVDFKGKVYPAKAQILNSSNVVKVWSEKVPYPVEVRYGYHNYYESSLFNNVGIPAAPFKMKIEHKTAATQKPALMWFDAEANFRRFSNTDTIDYYLSKIKSLGFTHAVVCLRPITGEVLYDSKISPIHKEWEGENHPGFDYLGYFIEQGHKLGLEILASMNVFCAGNNHKERGLVYEGHPEWASTYYDPVKGIIPITKLKGPHKYGAMVNPINEDYQKYIISVMKEIVTKYPNVDGLMLDRVRYDGINTDFSQLSRKKFEEYIGQKVKNFPGDILSWEKDGERYKPVYGELAKLWAEWRTKNITEFMARARKEVKAANPNVDFCTYTGAWYPSYYEVGVNFASKEYDPSKDFEWATPNYKNYGYAELIDIYATGNYYTDITLEDYRKNNTTVWNETDSQAQSGTWYCVEGSCQKLREILGNNDFMGGILVDQFYNNRQDLSRTIAQNIKDSDGLMVFDIVHIITKNLWKEVEEGMKKGGNL